MFSKNKMTIELTITIEGAFRQRRVLRNIIQNVMGVGNRSTYNKSSAYEYSLKTLYYKANK